MNTTKNKTLSYLDKIRNYNSYVVGNSEAFVGVKYRFNNNNKGLFSQLSEYFKEEYIKEIEYYREKGVDRRLPSYIRYWFNGPNSYMTNSIFTVSKVHEDGTVAFKELDISPDGTAISDKYNRHSLLVFQEITEI